MTTQSSSQPAPKIALVTGATGGIGQATSIALAAEGYTLALHYNSAPEDVRNTLLHKISTAQKSFNPSSTAGAAFFQADLSESDAVKHLHQAVTATFGDPTVLFLNAGMTAGISGPKSMADVSPDVFEKTWRVNTLAPYALTQLCLPAMESASFGRLIFNSSVAGITGGVVGPHYASSKSALHGLVHWLAGNVAKKGITVNAVAPALIEDTAMLPGGSGQGNELRNKIPVGRFGRPEEIASTVVWMVGNGYVTNKVIAVDGGMAYAA